MPWKKGQSGNPKGGVVGRRALSTDVREAARKLTDKALKTLEKVLDSETAPDNAKIAASVALLDRGHGRPEQSFTGALNAHYSISDKPLTAEEWQRQYATPAPVVVPLVVPTIALTAETPSDQAVN
jgi:hypothetical protein